MKKVLIVTALFLMTAGLFAAAQNYAQMTPEKRKAFAADWLETGKAYQANNKAKKAKACFQYVINSYPMGEAAAEARTILKTSYKINVPYNAEKTFAGFVKAGDSETAPVNRVNLYQMALEVKKDPAVYVKIALVYDSVGDNGAAHAAVKSALEAGLSADQLPEALKTKYQ